MEKGLNYYPFHLGDYATHTAHLEPMEDLAYRRMIDLYYRTEKPLPHDIEQIARLIRMKGHEAEISQVVDEFFYDCSEGWANARCDEEIAKMQDKQAKAKASAAASVKARSTNAQRTLNERHTSVELPTPTPTPTPLILEPQRASPNGSRLPADWVMTDEMEAFCKAERPDLVPSEVACRFSDYWHGVAGQKGRKADWLATWRNWVRNEKKQIQSFAQQAADIARTTVPSKPGRDPALLAIERDRAKATPPPPEILAQIAVLKGATFQ